MKDENKCCGNCRLFLADGKTDDGKRTGWCDNWAGVPIREDYICTDAHRTKREVEHGKQV